MDGFDYIELFYIYIVCIKIFGNEEVYLYFIV